MLLPLLILAALLLAYANGSNDNFKAAATIYGSGTLDYRRSLILASIAQAAGSVGSVFLADVLLQAFSGKGLVPPSVVQDPAFLVAVGTGAASTVLLASRLGIPISTTHAIIGGLVGGGSVWAPDQLSWNALGGRYFLPLLVSPLLAMLLSATLYPLMRSLRRMLGLSATTCLCLGRTVEPVVMRGGPLVLARTGATLSVAEREACTTRYDGTFLGVSTQRLVDTAHATSAFSLGLARGLNDTPKVMALLVAAGWSGVDPRMSLAIVAGAMLVGGLLQSRRVADTLGHRITGMSRGQGLLANGVASGLVIGASLIGSPVSTTHVSTGAIFGIGIWSDRADWRLAGGIVMAWVATLPFGALLAMGAAWSLRAL